MKRRYKWLSGVVLAVALLAAGALYFPWHATIENKLKGLLDEGGLKHVALRVSELGNSRVVLSDIAFEKQPATVAVKELVLDGDAPFTSLVTAEDKSWKGAWEIKGMNVAGLPLPIPALDGKGKAVMSQEAANVEGVFASKDHSHQLDFALDYPIQTPEGAALVVRKMVLPWNGGVISMRNEKIALAGNAPIRVTLQVKDVSLNALMQLLTGNRATATGNVSGALPLVISRSGEVMVHDAVLKTSEKGTISLQPDAIPGGNAQVDLLRTLLANFQYDEFSVSAQNGKDDKLSILLSLSGNNPEVYNGRVVKLNVNLGGDVVELVTQTLQLMNPEK